MAQSKGKRSWAAKLRSAARSMIAVAACIIFTNQAFAQATLFTYPVSPQIQSLSPEAQVRLSDIHARKTTSNLRHIRVDIDALNNSVLQMVMPDGSKVICNLQERATPLPNTEAWGGQSADGKSTCSFGYKRAEKEIAGVIVASGRTYRIEFLAPGQYVLVQVDESRRPRQHEQPSKSESSESNSPGSSGRAPSGESQGSTALSVTPVVIDLLVAYTPSVRARVGNPDAWLASALLNLNTILRTVDQIQVQARVVSFYEFPLNDAGVSTGNMLNVFSSNEGVRDRMLSSAADLMILITGNPLAICGQSVDIGPNPSTAYAAVNVECVTTQVGGNSLAHEIGHLFGAHHELALDGRGPSYSHAYVLKISRDAWCYKTIDASGDPDSMCDFPTANTTRVPTFSNPRRSLPFNIGPAGHLITADNSRLIAENASTVANFSAVRAAQSGGGGSPSDGVTAGLRAAIQIITSFLLGADSL